MRSPAWDFKSRQQFHLLSENYVQQNITPHVFPRTLFLLRYPGAP